MTWRLLSDERERLRKRMGLETLPSEIRVFNDVIRLVYCIASDEELLVIDHVQSMKHYDSIEITIEHLCQNS